jgi:hypothetical protein
MRATASKPSTQLARIARTLSRDLRSLRTGDSVACTYDPLTYAWKAHARYLALAHRAPRALLLGMNSQ